MNKVKKMLLAVGILSAGIVSAQNSDMKNMIKIGANVGLPISSDNASVAVGVDLSYQNLITPGFGLGIATGYTHYFGKENDGLDNNDFGVIPVAALVRIYPKQTGFYLGADLGYGFIIGDDQVASNYPTVRPDGGFYIKPEIGYHNQDWNFDIHYQKVFTGDDGKIGNQNYGAGNLGLGVSYNIPLGK